MIFHYLKAKCFTKTTADFTEVSGKYLLWKTQVPLLACKLYCYSNEFIINQKNSNQNYI